MHPNRNVDTLTHARTDAHTHTHTRTRETGASWNMLVKRKYHKYWCVGWWVRGRAWVARAARSIGRAPSPMLARHMPDEHGAAAVGFAARPMHGELGP